LTAAEFHRLADVPPEVEWFANLGNAHTRRAYENAVKDFMRFAGIRRPEEFRTVTRAHIIAWRDQLRRRELGGATIRHTSATGGRQDQLGGGRTPGLPTGADAGGLVHFKPSGR
jgi:integrase/recombinase XerD